MVNRKWVCACSKHASVMAMDLQAKQQLVHSWLTVSGNVPIANQLGSSVVIVIFLNYISLIKILRYPLALWNGNVGAFLKTMAGKGVKIGGFVLHLFYVARDKTPHPKPTFYWQFDTPHTLVHMLYQSRPLWYNSVYRQQKCGGNPQRATSVTDRQKDRQMTNAIAVTIQSECTTRCGAKSFNFIWFVK